MARSEWLRTFVAVYRAGSVTAGARQRGLSQPAASQQLAALQALAGAPLFTRAATGVRATARGRELYGQVADALDRLEGVLGELDGGRLPELPVVRIGASAEYAALRLVPALASLQAVVHLRLDDDAQLMELLDVGEVDVVCLPRLPERRDVAVRALAPEGFALVAAPGLAPPSSAIADPHRLGSWLSGRPWAAVTVELPRTRRLWADVLGRPFAGDLRLVAPDRRVVLAAVTAGIGFSLLPRYVCQPALDQGLVLEVGAVGGALAGEPWFASMRPSGGPRAALLEGVLDALGEGAVPA